MGLPETTYYQPVNDWVWRSTGRQTIPLISLTNVLTKGGQLLSFLAKIGQHRKAHTRQHTQQCPLCSHPCETVDHHLFKCSALADIRNLLLPPIPNTQNTLYGDRQQLEKTCKFHYLALCRRADAQVQLDL
ncbi:hypothetical protein BsWGS_18583 [Bradybaena similaris]